MLYDVREIRPNECEALLHLYTELHNNSMPADKKHVAEVWHTIQNDSNHHIIVVMDGEKMISSCVCVIVPNLTRGIRPYALIENVITSEGYRGRGLATACLQYAKDIAQKEHCYKIMLLSGSRSEATLQFYEHAGYNRKDKTAFIQWLDE